MKKTSGFVALISVIIISAILLLVATNLSFTGFYGRFNILDSEYKEKSLALAEACADEAILNITVDTTYTGDETILLPPSECRIGTVTTSGLNKNFTASAVFQNSYTNLRISFDTDSYLVTLWEEVPNF